ncbi:MAG: GNAT family N-acetyltransferase [Candidatus Thorarchaeota archaeon]|nr:GNAT family N-acetyltransferase [Candidatus Thorarchaeota archaeon]
MIVEWPSEDRTLVRLLFDSHTRARAVIFPALDQGRGTVWTNSTEKPTVARLQLAIINVVTGDAASPDAEEIIRMIEPMQIVFGPDDEWARIIKDLWGERLGIQQRTLLSPESLDIDHLRHLQDQLPEGYQLERGDLETIRRIDKRRAMHIPTFFGNSEDFHKMGLAYCIKYKGEVVSMASTFTPFTDMFEIQVDTLDTDHRRKGLATVVSAALVVHALENGMIPHWDATNEASIHLALKLGYTNPVHWDAYYLKPSE